MGNKEEFNDILNECLEKLLNRGETLEQCLMAYPEQASTLRPLLETALTAKKAMAVPVRPELRLRFQQQLHASLQPRAVQRRSPFFSWSRQWATAVAIILVLVLASGGTVAAASSAMPDSPLYPVKQATEQTRLKLAPSDIAKAQLYARFADRRVREIAYLASRNPEKAQKIVEQLDATLQKVAVLADVHKQRDVAALAPAAGTEAAKGVPAPVPAPAPPTAPQTTPVPAPTTPAVRSPDLKRGPGDSEKDGRRSELKKRLAENYQEHRRALREALEKAPNEEARKAILQAITVSQKGYERALKALEEENGRNGGNEGKNPQSRLKATPRR
ncbi:MAG: hypothetical protein HY667_00305 [Chloroflexi bacterium]|nr:hypothetical protein [Chloroflexota bacterium]